jgi:mercuric ion transport protein
MHTVAESEPARRPGRPAIAVFGAVGAAFLASLCCIGPLLFVTLGIGAGLASRLEPLRPYFTGLTIVLLIVGFYTVYGRRARATAAVCEADGWCAHPRALRRDKLVLWVATIVALLVLTFPQWSLLLV